MGPQGVVKGQGERAFGGPGVVAPIVARVKISPRNVGGALLTRVDGHTFECGPSGGRTGIDMHGIKPNPHDVRLVGGVKGKSEGQVVSLAGWQGRQSCRLDGAGGGGRAFWLVLIGEGQWIGRRNGNAC